jgi:tripartite-type tricarboxylate transporter receptor subunit TctC
MHQNRYYSVSSYFTRFNNGLKKATGIGTPESLLSEKSEKQYHKIYKILDDKGIIKNLEESGIGTHYLPKDPQQFYKMVPKDIEQTKKFIQDNK